MKEFKKSTLLLALVFGVLGCGGALWIQLLGCFGDTGSCVGAKESNEAPMMALAKKSENAKDCLDLGVNGF